MPWDANGRWTPEDDSVAKQLTGLLATNSTYIQRARQGGMATANKRGLLNSSLAAGAGEAAAIDAAQPIASQDAAQTFQRNQAVLEGGLLYDNQSKLAEQKFGFDTRLNTQQNDAQLTRDRLGADTQLTLQQREAQAAAERLQMQIAGASAQQLREFDQRTAEQLRSIAADTAHLTQQQEGALTLQRDAAGANERLQAQQDAAARDRLQLEQSGATAAQLRDFDQRTAEQIRSLTAQTEQQREQQSGQLVMQREAYQQNAALQNAQTAVARERMFFEQAGATAAQLREFDQRTAEQQRALASEEGITRLRQSGAETLQQMTDAALTARLRMEQEGATATQLREFDQRTQEQIRALTADSARLSQQQAGAVDLQAREAGFQKERDLLVQQGATASQLREFDQRIKEQTASLSSAERQAMMSADVGTLQTQIGANSQLSSMYLQAFSNLANNDQIPADVRNAYITEFQRVMKQGQDLIAIASNTPLTWGPGAT